MVTDNGYLLTQNIPQQLGHYRLSHVLRRGGFATVYIAEHLHLHMQVAVKVLHSWGEWDHNARCLLAEARLHASLRHPHIVRVLDFGLQGHIPFLVMDYASQGTLQEYFPQGVSFPLTTILPFVTQIASALQYIHQRNLIHCDIKPQNILLGPGNQVWLSDFGIALTAQQWDQQYVQVPMGTAAYVAPEQINGKPLPASDQYALAVLTYSWLCGEPPFVGTSLQVCLQHLSAQVPSLRDKVSSVGTAVERVILRALSKEPGERFARIRDFAAALQQASQIQEKAIYPVSLVHSLLRDGPPHPRVSKV
jgi:serine/threonine protein kinase